MEHGLAVAGPRSRPPRRPGQEVEVLLGEEERRDDRDQEDQRGVAQAKPRARTGARGTTCVRRRRTPGLDRRARGPAPGSALDWGRWTMRLSLLGAGGAAGRHRQAEGATAEERALLSGSRSSSVSIWVVLALLPSRLEIGRRHPLAPAARRPGGSGAGVGERGKVPTGGADGGRRRRRRDGERAAAAARGQGRRRRAAQGADTSGGAGSVTVARGFRFLGDGGGGLPLGAFELLGLPAHRLFQVVAPFELLGAPASRPRATPRTAYGRCRRARSRSSRRRSIFRNLPDHARPAPTPGPAASSVRRRGGRAAG